MATQLAELQLAELQRSYRRLIGGLAFFELTHLLGLLATSLWLLPGLSPTRPYAERAAYIVSNLVWWRLAWLPWQLSAVSDLWVAAALIGWTSALGARRARRWAWCSAGFLLLAIVPEQYSEASLVSSFPSATGALWREQLARYMWLLGTWANTGYTLMTGCWLLALRGSVIDREPTTLHARGLQEPSRAGVWPRWAEAALLGLFLASSFSNHLAWSPRSGVEHTGAFQLTSLLNGLAFPGLLVLGVAIAMQVGEGQSRATRAAAETRPRWPHEGARLGAWVARLAGSPGLRDLIRAVQSKLPFPRLHSDVGDVLYLNWLVSAERVEARLPAGLRVRRFGDLTPLSVLIFRHGHFGPALLGPLRKLLPSPIQCNTRAYLEAPPLHVSFLANSIDHAGYFLGSRLLCDGLPVHYPASARLERSAERLDVALDPGRGSALGLRVQVEETSDLELPPAFAACFADFAAAIEYIVPQNAALRALPTTGGWCASLIVVEAQLEGARPCRIRGAVELGPQLAELVQGAEPLAFRLGGVRFAVVGEALSLQREALARGNGPRA